MKSKILEVKVTCLNAGNRPKGTPNELWLKSGKEYTVIHVFDSINPNQIGKSSFVLKEIDTIDAYEKGIISFNSFDSDRFNLMNLNQIILMKALAILSNQNKIYNEDEI